MTYRITEKEQLRWLKLERKIGGNLDHTLVVVGEAYEGPHVTKAMSKAIKASRWRILFVSYTSEMAEVYTELSKKAAVTPKALSRVLENAWRVRQIRFRDANDEPFEDGLLIEKGNQGVYYAVPVPPITSRVKTAGVGR
jgi:hypothetical protein